MIQVLLSPHLFSSFLSSMRPSETIEYNYDVEDFLLRVIFHNLYNFGSMSSYCTPYWDCDDCVECPKKGYQEFASKVRANCSQLMVECSWNDKPFDCCTYFMPLKTTMGICYLLNSVQTVRKGGKKWLPMIVGFKEGNGNLQIRVSKSASVRKLRKVGSIYQNSYFSCTSLMKKTFHTCF